MTIDEIFDKWKKDLMRDPQKRFLHKERPEVLQDLVALFISYDITYEDAKYFKHKVVKFLTTEQGRKGSGKHKGWKETVEEEYMATIADAFIPDVDTDEVLNQLEIDKQSEKHGIIQESEIITKWAKWKFKDMWNLEINYECHTINSSLNLLFQVEVFDNRDFEFLK